MFKNSKKRYWFDKRDNSLSGKLYWNHIFARNCKDKVILPIRLPKHKTKA